MSHCGSGSYQDCVCVCVCATKVCCQESACWGLGILKGSVTRPDLELVILHCLAHGHDMHEKCTDVRVGPYRRLSTKELWCFQIVLLEKTLERPLDCKEIKLVDPEGNHPWIFIRKTDAGAEAPVLWPPDARSRLIGKDLEADWRQNEKRATGNEMVGWHHWHKFKQTPGRYQSVCQRRKLTHQSY